MIVGRNLRLAILVWLVAGVASAEAPNRSIRPVPKPVMAQPVETLRPVTPVATAVAVPTSLPMTLRPRARPADLLLPAPIASASQPGADAAQAAAAPSQRSGGLFGFLRPAKRPSALAEGQKAAAVREKSPNKPALSNKGSVCGNPAIKGEPLAPITSKVKGCGIAEPVRLTSVNGIRLANGATVTCDTARALQTWVTKAVEPVYGKGKVVELRIAASYACRPRNNQRGNRISEHGRGNAIDIAAFVFSNGKETPVLRGYDKKMRQVHKAACGIFGTTLGPGSDGFHEDHLHFDIARYRNGPYCR